MDYDDLKSIAQILGFKYLTDVRGITTPNDLFKDKPIQGKSPFSGVYMLAYSDGGLYIGQTTNIKRRLAQHRENGYVIDYLAFKPCFRKENLLAEEEKSIKQAIGMKLPLTNEELVMSTLPIDESHFDEIVSPEEQELFISNIVNYLSINGQWANRIKLAKRTSLDDWQHFKLLPKAMDILALTKNYIYSTIPSPEETVDVAWRINLLPKSRRVVENYAMQVTCGSYNVFGIYSYPQLTHQYFVRFALAADFFHDALSHMPQNMPFPWATLEFPDEPKQHTVDDLENQKSGIHKQPVEGKSPEEIANRTVREIALADAQNPIWMTVPLDAFEETIKDTSVCTAAAIHNIACMRDSLCVQRMSNNELAQFWVLNF